jgi:phosphoribosylanthranilate isomerase
MTNSNSKKTTLLKICGITRPQDLVVCHNLGVNLIGFNFHKKSKRYIEPKQASLLWQAFLKQIPGAKLIPVLVCVDAEPSDLKLWAGLFPNNLIFQMHGNETPEYLSQCLSLTKREIWKAVPVEPTSVRDDVKAFQSCARRILLDSPTVLKGSDVAGGSGTAFLWDEYKDLINRPYVGVAGGINPDNIEQLLHHKPSLVDVASGSESAPGIKDSAKIQRLVSACRKAVT